MMTVVYMDGCRWSSNTQQQPFKPICPWNLAAVPCHRAGWESHQRAERGLYLGAEQELRQGAGQWHHQETGEGQHQGERQELSQGAGQGQHQGMGKGQHQKERQGLRQGVGQGRGRLRGRWGGAQ